MAGKQMWFGTRGYETWVPTPAINPDYGRNSFSTGETTGINGVGFVDGSKSGHNIYRLSWNPTKSRDDIRTITDFADGVYDSKPGINLIYWIDPMARDKNLLPQEWATPHLATEDGVPLVTEADGSGRPKAVGTPTNSFRYPARGARYVLKPTSDTQEIYIPIEPGFSAWVGIHGDSATQGNVLVQPVNGYTTVGSPVAPTVLGVDTQVLVNTEFPLVNSSGIVIKFATPVTNQTFILYGLIVQLLPTGQSPNPSNWISGQGHSGCQFVAKPSKTPYSAALGEDGRVAATATLKETGMGL